MRPTRSCPRCRTPLLADARACPRCLFEAALESEPAPEPDPVVVTRATGPRPEPPSQEEVERVFVEFDGFELLGRGGMGVVYKARQKKLERFVALKILPRALGADASFRERFLREARALARLVHQNIVAVHDFGEHEGLCFLVLEYVDGTNLRTLLREHPPAPREALGIVRVLCDALQYAHDEGVVHRDIKPENVLVDRTGRVKIADFGLAKVIGIEPEAHLTAVGQVLGTPHYMAPEQIERPREVDHRADLFALGVVLYEMLTGSLPRGAFELPSSRLQVDVRLDDVVLKALERDPVRRYQHAIEVKSDVEAIESTPIPESSMPRTRRATAPARESLLTGFRAVVLWIGTWIVTAVLWNLGPFALGVGAVLVLGTAVVSLRERLRELPELNAAWNDLPASRRARRRFWGIALGFSAWAALIFGHVALWERGTASWAPSFTDADEVQLAQVPSLRMRARDAVNGETPPAVVQTRTETTGTRKSPGLPWEFPPVAAFSLSIVLSVAAGYLVFRGGSRSVRRVAWHSAGRLALQPFAGLACVWAACWLVSLRDPTPLGDVTSSFVHQEDADSLRQAMTVAVKGAGLTLELDQHLRSTDGEGRLLWNGYVLRFAARSPFARWELGLAGARRKSPQLWCVLGESPGIAGTQIEAFAGRYPWSGGQSRAYGVLDDLRSALHGSSK